MKSTLIKVGLCLLVLFLLGSCIYQDGKSNGEAIVQKEFDKYVADKKAEIDLLVTEYGTKEKNHRLVNEGINHDLAEAKQTHAVAIANLRSDLTARLRSSETRAGVYKRQAESGPIECSRLAEHATQLDGTIEQGRSLVRELGETIKLRDKQIIDLAKQIKNDRALLNDTGI